MTLTIIADIQAEPDKAGLVREELLKLIQVTRAEPGCLLYALHEDHADPAHFLFTESWQDRALWQQHMQAPHLARYMAATEGAVARFTLHEMRPIG